MSAKLRAAGQLSRLLTQNVHGQLSCSPRQTSPRILQCRTFSGRILYLKLMYG